MQLYDMDAEKSVLSQLLTDNTIFPDVCKIISADDFYSTVHQGIFKAIESIINSGLQADIQTVFRHVKNHAGEIAALTSMPGSNFEYYSKIVKNYAVKRQLFKLSDDISLSLKNGKSADEITDLLNSAISDVQKTETADYLKFGHVLKETFKEIEAANKSGKSQTIYSGLRNLDSISGGFQPSEYIVLGARTSIGKSLLGANIAENIARKGIPVGILSLEMKDTILGLRFLSGESMVPTLDIRKNSLTEKQMAALADAVSRLYTLPIFISDASRCNLSHIKNTIRKMVRAEGCKVVIIDYLGYIRENGPAPRWEKIGLISSELKAIARSLNIVLLTLCQIGRQSEDKPPTLADLRDSGSIEQDADQVILLHRERGEALTDLNLAKNRNGQTGKCNLRFSPTTMRFYDC